MSVQNLVMQKGSGSFIVAGTQLSGTSLGSPYPSSAVTTDFTVLSSPEQNMLSGANHPTTPQHDSTHPTVAFLYSSWT